MTEFEDILNDIVENDAQESESRDEDVIPESEADNREEQAQEAEYSYDYGSEYSNGADFNGTPVNSIGRSAVESMIKNAVYEKYNIDSKAMKDFARLSPTEMLSDFKGSVSELGKLRSDYSDGQYTREEYKALSGKIKGEISGKMLEIGSCRKSILEDILLRSFDVSPSDFSQVRTFSDLIDVFKGYKEPDSEADKEIMPDIDTEEDADFETVDYTIKVDRKSKRGFGLIGGKAVIVRMGSY